MSLDLFLKNIPWPWVTCKTGVSGEAGTVRAHVLRLPESQMILGISTSSSPAVPFWWMRRERLWGDALEPHIKPVSTGLRPSSLCLPSRRCPSQNTHGKPGQSGPCLSHQPYQLPPSLGDLVLGLRLPGIYSFKQSLEGFFLKKLYKILHKAQVKSEMHQWSHISEFSIYVIYLGCTCLQAFLNWQKSFPMCCRKINARTFVCTVVEWFII